MPAPVSQSARLPVNGDDSSVINLVLSGAQVELPNATARMRVPYNIRVANTTDDVIERRPIRTRRASDVTPAGGMTSSSVRDMLVPERIIVRGDGQHLTGASETTPRELRLEQQHMWRHLYHADNSGSAATYNSLTSPPDVLRVDDLPPGSYQVDLKNDFSDVSFTAANDNSLLSQNINTDEQIISGHQASAESVADESAIYNNQQTTRSPSVEHVSLAMTSIDGAAERRHFRRQIARANRRVAQLELESRQRNSREMFVLSAGVVYVVIKVVMWLGRLLAR